MMSHGAPNAYSFLKSPAACSMRIDGAYAVEPPASFPEAPLLVPERIADSEVIQLDGKSLYSRSVFWPEMAFEYVFYSTCSRIAKSPGFQACAIR